MVDVFQKSSIVQVDNQKLGYLAKVFDLATTSI